MLPYWFLYIYLPEIHAVKLAKGSVLTQQDGESFLRALEARFGKAIVIRIESVGEIAREKSGKFQILKNPLNNSQVSV